MRLQIRQRTTIHAMLCHGIRTRPTPLYRARRASKWDIPRDGGVGRRPEDDTRERVDPSRQQYFVTRIGTDPVGTGAQGTRRGASQRQDATDYRPQAGKRDR